MAEENDNLEEIETIEIDEDKIQGYIVDEDGEEIGVVILDEDGDEVEIYYDEDMDVEDIDDEDDPLSSIFEIEVDEDDILYYLMSKEGKEIGFVMRDEDGEKVEYFYPEEDEAEEDPETKPEKAKDDGVTKEDLKDMASTFKDLAMEGYSAIADIMDEVDDMRDSLDAINPKKRRQARREAQRKAASESKKED